MTDRELVEGLTVCDRLAINYLVTTYQNKVIKTAYYFIGNMEDAEDLSQDIFLEIIRSAGRFKGNSSFSTWVYRIIVNRSLNVIKRNKRRMIFGNLENLFKKNGDQGYLSGEEPSDFHDQIDAEETREFLNKAINALPENQKTAFVLSKYEELTYNEIADIMNHSVSSVESLIHRAKINLQKRLVGHFSQYSKK